MAKFLAVGYVNAAGKSAVVRKDEQVIARKRVIGQDNKAVEEAAAIAKEREAEVAIEDSSLVGNVQWFKDGELFEFPESFKTEVVDEETGEIKLVSPSLNVPEQLDRGAKVQVLVSAEDLQFLRKSKVCQIYEGAYQLKVTEAGGAVSMADFC